jgi:hypothetical protein
MQYRLAATWERRPALIAALRYPYEIVDRYEEAVVAMLKKRKGRSAASMRFTGLWGLASAYSRDTQLSGMV